jgi:predicted transcriptional regulator
MLNAVRELPDDASVEDAMEKLLVLAKIERGLAQADRGEILTHQEVKDRMAKWLK